MKVYNKIENIIIDIKNENVFLMLKTYPNIFELYDFTKHGPLPIVTNDLSGINSSLDTINDNLDLKQDKITQSFDVSFPNFTTTSSSFVTCLDESAITSNGFNVKVGNKILIMIQIQYKLTAGGADQGTSFELIKNNNGNVNSIGGGFASEVFEAKVGSNAVTSLPVNTITLSCVDVAEYEGSYGVLVNVRADLGANVLIQNIKRTLIKF